MNLFQYVLHQSKASFSFKPSDLTWKTYNNFAS